MPAIPQKRKTNKITQQTQHIFSRTCRYGRCRNSFHIHLKLLFSVLKLAAVVRFFFSAQSIRRLAVMQGVYVNCSGENDFLSGSQMPKLAKALWPVVQIVQKPLCNYTLI